jgi:flavin reductase (DIM6/NTAB) family NADH-FMN oxidoreductase RutF
VGESEAQTERTFHALVADLDYPMFVVTAADGEERDGCLVGFATQTSVDPPRFLVCLSSSNLTYEIACRADVLGVHLLPHDGGDLARLFGAQSGHDVDKLAQCEWRAGPGGAPILAGCENWFAGRVLERTPAGDHDAFLLEPVAAEQGRLVTELTFRRVKRMEPGREA